jgi:phosphonopyruvate decarboxylase
VIEAGAFLAAAATRGFDFYSGVPCSFLTPIINRVIGDRSLTYIGATSEGEAIALAAGAWLAGRKTVVMMQNSGLGNAVNPLASLNFPFLIPTLVIVTWRGEPLLKDEPQHALMGEITAPLLDTLRIAHRLFPQEPAEIAPALAQAEESMHKRALPFALILRHGSVRAGALDEPELPPRPAGQGRDRRRGGGAPTRAAALTRLLELVPERAALIATTGKTGRELFTLADRPQHLYVVGSMGCASALGLGVALNSPRPVIVIDGDGAALMKLGNCATIGARAPRNLIHLVLDNGGHDSTGGQRTVSASVDFAGVALNCGYASGTRVDALDEFAAAVGEALTHAGPHLIHLRIAPGALAKLGRPTIAPPQVARRFQEFLRSG